MAGLLQDLQYSLRRLLKSPGFTIVAVLTLGLGIGANVAVFTVMNATLLNPSGIPEPKGAVALRVKYAAVGDLQNIGISAPDFGDALSGKDIFASAAILQSADFNYAPDGSTPERLIGAKVSWQFFDVFWARPAVGRVFRPEEDQPNATHQVVLAYRTWKRRFGGDPTIIGRSILLNQESYQVVGVMQPEFGWPNQVELWVPLGLPSGQYFDRGFRYNEWYFGVARLRRGRTVADANRFLGVRTAQQIASEGASSYGRSAGWSMFAMSLAEFVAGDLRLPLRVLQAAVATVLLIACANIAGLQLARASERQHETSVRIALGAGNGALVRQILTENLLLGAGGVLAGMALARLCVPILLALAPENLAANVGVHMGGPVLQFVVLVGLVCSCLCGAAPAWSMTRVQWFQSLKEAGRSGGSGLTRQRARSTLVVAEIAMAMLLLVAAGLLVRSLKMVELLDTGFDPHQVMSAALTLPPTVYKSPEQQAAFYTAIEDHLKHIPGVTSAGITNALPFTDSGGAASFMIKGRVQAANDPGPHGKIRTISPDYFQTLEIPLVRGRVFTAGDGLNSQRVAVVDDTLARQYWPGEDPLGQQIKLSFDSNSPWITVVGVVKHSKSSSLEADTSEGFYFLPIAQLPDVSAGIVVRGAGSVESLGSAMREAVRRIDASQSLYDLQSMDERVDRSLVGRRFLVLLLSVFAGLALLLAALGLYGIVSHSVRMRTPEVGVRMALGASRADVLHWVLSNAARLAAVGLVLGAGASLAAGRALSSLLYRVSFYNPVILFLSSILLAGTVFLASYIPARSAAKVDPMVALRYE